MAHFAEIDENNIVKRVLVVPDSQQHRGHDFLHTELRLGGTWIQTSYNTRGGVHYTEVPAGTRPSKDFVMVDILSSGSLSTRNFVLSAGPLSSVPISAISLVHVASAIPTQVTVYALSADNKPHLRYNYAGIGYTYDLTADAFYAPQPFLSWSLNTTTYLWEPPVPYPTDNKVYTWDEVNKLWVESND